MLRRQQTFIEGPVSPCHQRRDELLCRKTTERAVFRRHNDVKPARRRGNLTLWAQLVQRLSGGFRGDIKRLPGIGRGKVVAPGRGELVDVIPCGYGFRFRFHSVNVSFVDTLRKRNRQQSGQILNRREALPYSRQGSLHRRISLSRFPSPDP